MNEHQHILMRLVTVTPTLRGSEARLLTFLTGLAVKDRSIEVEVSEEAIKAGTRLCAWSIWKAKQSLHLQGHISLKPGDRTHNRDRYYLLYLNGSQLPLFEPTALEARAPTALETRGPALETRAHTALETRGPALETRAHTALETRGPALETRGELPWKPGDAALETRGDATPGPRASHSPARAHRSIEDSFVGSSSIDRSIEAPHGNEHEHETPAANFADSLYRYMLAKADSTWHHRRPDKRIVADCLAIAPLPDLTRVLRQLFDEDRRGMTSYAWFVTALRQRLQGISPPATPTAEQPPVRKEIADASYSADLVNRLTSGVRSPSRHRS